MSTRCKFVCNELTERQGWGSFKTLYSAKFSPVMNGSEENRQFFAASPSGMFEIGTITKKAFEVGKEYYLDIVEAVQVP